MDNSLTVYYKPITGFLNGLKHRYANDLAIEIEVIEKSEEKLNYKTLDFNFYSKNADKISFCISLSYNEFDAPRIMMSIKKPDSKEIYEVIDEYLDKKDYKNEDIIRFLKCVLSNDFKIVYSFLKEKKIRENYIYYIFSMSKETIINSLGYKRGIVFPWNKSKIKKEVFEFKPWIITEFTVSR